MHPESLDLPMPMNLSFHAHIILTRSPSFHALIFLQTRRI